MKTLQELTQTLKYTRKISSNEQSSECPRCGGTQHHNGEFPDRFRIWYKSKTTGGPLGWCRKCGYTWQPKGEYINTSQHKAWVQERTDIELERQKSIDHALELLRQEKVWIKYHSNLAGELRQYYHKRNIDDFWIDYWSLGYNPSKSIWDGKSEHITPALTIPVFEPVSQKIITLRNRLLNPTNPNDKYRPERAGLPSGLFSTNLEDKPSGRVLIVEGEFKAMTTYLTIDDPKLFVVGVPGKTPSLEILNQLEDCETVYLLLDPDAYIGQNSPIERLCSHFKSKARVISLPDKIDDMIIKGYLGQDDIKRLLQYARKV